MPAYDDLITIVGKAVSPAQTIVGKGTSPAQTIVGKGTSPAQTIVGKAYSINLATEDYVPLLAEDGAYLTLEG